MTPVATTGARMMLGVVMLMLVAVLPVALFALGASEISLGRAISATASSVGPVMGLAGLVWVVTAIALMWSMALARGARVVAGDTAS